MDGKNLSGKGIFKKIMNIIQKMNIVDIDINNENINDF